MNVFENEMNKQKQGFSSKFEKCRLFDKKCSLLVDFPTTFVYNRQICFCIFQEGKDARSCDGYAQDEITAIRRT